MSRSELDDVLQALDKLAIKEINTEIKNMPNQYSIKDITPAHLCVLPTFEGDPNTLSRYISACEHLIRIFASENNADPINAHLLQIFQSKLVGRAEILLGVNENINNWNELKELLQNNFCDQRSEDCLEQDIQNLYPSKNETAYNFGLRVKNLRNLLLSRVKLTENNADTRVFKSAFYNNKALRVYLRGLEIIGEIGFRVKIRQPNSIETAMTYVIEEENSNYYAKRPHNLNRHEIKPIAQHVPLRMQSLPVSHHSPVYQSQNFAPVFKTPVHQTQNITPTFKQQIPPRPFFPQQQNTRPYWQQQQMRPITMAPSKSSPSQFAKSPGQLEQRRQPRQVPMEVGSSRMTKQGQPQRSHQYFKSTGQPQWIAEELHHQEEEEQPQYSQDYYAAEYTEGEFTTEENEAHYQEEHEEEEEKFSFASLRSDKEQIEEIKLNNQTTSKLPYIFVPEINAKFLIDTGASRSMVSTSKLNEYFNDYVQYEPFTVQTAHAKTKHKYIIEIPSMKTFNAAPQMHKFHVFDFSDKYDGLIGITLLEQLEANIDIANKILRTKFGDIPIHFEDNKIQIGPRERKMLESQ